MSGLASILELFMMDSINTETKVEVYKILEINQFYLIQ